MNTVYVKLRNRDRNNKYRKMLSTHETIFEKVENIVTDSCNYSPGALLDEGEWFKIENISIQHYAIDIISTNFESVDFDVLSRTDFKKIDFLFVKDATNIYFQKVSKAKLASKKKLGRFGGEFQYQSDCEEIVVNDYPDAIYCGEEDILYFRRLEPIVNIFKGIGELYREATDSETKQFLESEFISLKDNYGVANVKTANRKRIALAAKTLCELTQEDQVNIFNYIGEYCPDLKTQENTFAVGSEAELKMVLFGIEQRFYTTPVGKEKRIANAVLPLD